MNKLIGFILAAQIAVLPSFCWAQESSQSEEARLMKACSEIGTDLIAEKINRQIKEDTRKPNGDPRGDARLICDQTGRFAMLLSRYVVVLKSCLPNMEPLVMQRLAEMQRGVQFVQSQRTASQCQD